MEEWIYKSAAFSTFLIGVVIILYFGSPFLQPLAFGAIFAMLIHPMESHLRHRGLPAILSIGISVLLVSVLLAGILWLLFWQISELSDRWPEIQNRIVEIEQQIKAYIIQQWGVQQETLDTALWPSIGTITGQLMSLTSRLLGVLWDLLLILVLTVLFLASKERFQFFLLDLAGKGRDEQSKEVIYASSRIARKYLRGKLLVTFILALMYAGGFLLIGIEFAILLALLGAILSLIPYLGNILAGLLAISLAMVSGAGLAAVLLIILVMSITQVIESYLLTPLILGDLVDLSPFGAIVSVLAFTMVWGISGAIIAIPLAAILRIFLQETKQLRALTDLLGEEKSKS